MPELSFFWWGVIGGLIPEAIKFHKKRGKFKPLVSDFFNAKNKNDRKIYFVVMFLYFLATIIMVLLGGWLAFLYQHFDVKINALAAIQIGATAPFLFAALAEHAQK
ncbi:MAG: hypothetical protein IH901_06260 [Proteobacteria bacterium]|nr:hypothetical protein [Pseudomonadota bacterium]